MLRHLLLIDDDEDESDFFSLVLEQLPPVKYSFADNARLGLELIKKERPDLVMLDMNMPAVNGLECLKEIRRHDELRHIPIYIYSNSNDDGLSRAALQNGASGCLKKPQSIEVLKKLIEKTLADTETEAIRFRRERNT